MSISLRYLVTSAVCAMFATMAVASVHAEDVRLWKKQHPGSHVPYSVSHSGTEIGNGMVVRSYSYEPAAPVIAATPAVPQTTIAQSNSGNSETVRSFSYEPAAPAANAPIVRSYSVEPAQVMPQVSRSYYTPSYFSAPRSRSTTTHHASYMDRKTHPTSNLRW